MDAAEECMHEAYHKMMDENKDLEIVAQPVVDLKNVSKECVEFEFTLTLKPTVKLGEYKNLNVKKESTKVTKEEIEKAIKEMQNRFAENVVKEEKHIEEKPKIRNKNNFNMFPNIWNGVEMDLY